MIAIRGATTVNEDTKEDISSAAIELMSAIIESNNLMPEEVISVIFSCTEDIKSDYPGKYIREYFKWNKIAFMHFNEMDVQDSLKKCIRVMLLINREHSDDINFIYLNNARELRKDLIVDSI